MGEALDLLQRKMDTVALAGRIRVSAYERTSSTGNRVHVSAYTRSPSQMSLGEISDELRTLTDNSPQTLNRKAALIQEQRRRLGQAPHTAHDEIAVLKRKLARVGAPGGQDPDRISKIEAEREKLHQEIDHLVAEIIVAGDSGAHHPKTFKEMLEHNLAKSAAPLAYMAIVGGIDALLQSIGGGVG